MKKISEHLGQIIVCLAAVALLISVVTVFSAPISGFFTSIVDQEKSVGNQIMTSIESIDVSNISVAGGESGGSGGGGGNSEPVEVVTNYTQDDIDNSGGKLVALGGTNPLYVVAAFNDDGTALTVTKNGADSDGKMTEKYSNAGMDFPPFMYDSNIKSITIENGVTNIGKAVFACCTDCTNITIPESVTSIGDEAFIECRSLTSITIPNSVTYIGNYAFDTSNLTSITFNGTVVEWATITFGTGWDNNTGNYMVHCTDGDIPKA